MARHSVVVLLAVLSCILKLGLSQEQVLVQNAQQKNLVDVQFFADTNFQQTRTPFAYFDFPAIQQGSCTQCENIPDSPVVWGSAVIAYSPTGGEVLDLYPAANCAGEPLTTGASAPNLPPSFQTSAFKICRTG
ncbi:hypothetical protein COCOBI_07-5600 [Coccomyxa sp. Obi]|nr:hypothetical protein COCOBI_07-5600 [Coccomyxa sp. Obi]